ncbi:RHS repeat-associated core domain-containing protein [Candidatus Aenigmatarchaeota archaeon]
MHKVRHHHLSSIIVLIILLALLFWFVAFYEFDTIGEFKIGTIDDRSLVQERKHPTYDVIEQPYEQREQLVEKSKTSYLYGLGLTLRQDDGGITYYHQDHLSSNRFSTGPDGQLTSENVQYPYGSSFAEAGTKQADTNYKFTGQEQDKSLYYYGARYYDPIVARFISVDPIFSPTVSPYAYVANNPLKYVDPSGMVEELINTYHGTSVGVVKTWLLTTETDILEQGYVRVGSREEGAWITTEIKRAALKARGNAYGAEDLHTMAVKRLGDKAPPLDDFRKPTIVRMMTDQGDVAMEQVNFIKIDDIGVLDADFDPINIDTDWAKTENIADDLERAARKGNFASITRGVDKASTAGKILKKLGKFGKILPFVGIGAGLASGSANAAQGNYFRAGCDYAGCIPIVGNAVDAAVMGYDTMKTMSTWDGPVIGNAPQNRE